MRNEIRNAVRALGETSQDIYISDRGLVAVVFINREYFGIYDYERKTFVD